MDFLLYLDTLILKDSFVSLLEIKERFVFQHT